MQGKAFENVPFDSTSFFFRLLFLFKQSFAFAFA